MATKKKKTAARKTAARSIRKTTRKPAARKKAARVRTPAAGDAATAEAANIKRLQAPVTMDVLAAEAAALGNSTDRMRLPRADIVTDAREALDASKDLPDLKKRKFPINHNTLKRMELLVDALGPTVVESDLARADSKENTAANERRRKRLLEIRSRLARLASAVGLPADWFKLTLRKTDRLNPVAVRLGEIVILARRKQRLLPDAKTVEALLTEAEKLLAEHTATRVDNTQLAGGGKASMKRVHQYTALLWEVLRHVSTVGLAAYPDDPAREERYRLNHLYDGGFAPENDGDAEDGGKAEDDGEDEGTPG